MESEDGNYGGRLTIHGLENALLQEAQHSDDYSIRSSVLQSSIKKTEKNIKIRALTAGASHPHAVFSRFAPCNPTPNPQALKPNVANAKTTVIHDCRPKNCGDLAKKPMAKQASTAMSRDRLVYFNVWLLIC